MKNIYNSPSASLYGVHLSYIFFYLGCITGFPIILGVINNWYLKQSPLTFVCEHLRYLNRTAAFSLTWLSLSLLLTYIFIGYLTVFIAWFWLVYRVISGHITFIKFQKETAATDVLQVNGGQA